MTSRNSLKRLSASLKEIPRFLKSPKSQLRLWNDLRRLRASTGFIREHAFPPSTGKTVLVPVTNNKPFECKLVALLAVGLRLAGWKVRVLLLSRRDLWARRYLDAFGFTDYLYWEDFELPRATVAECAREAGELLGGELTFSALKNWSYRDCWIGPNILASVSRETHQGAPDLADPGIRAKLAKILPKSLEVVRIAEKLMGAVQPDLIYLIEANYFKNGPLTDVAIKFGVDFIQTPGCVRDDALMFRRLSGPHRREHPWAMSRENLLRLAREPWTGREEAELAQVFRDLYGETWVIQKHHQLGTRPFEREEIFETLDLDPSKKVAILFSHVLWDANLFFGEDLFEDYGDWFIQTVKAACENDAVNWLIKLHPTNAWKIRRDDDSRRQLSELALIEAEIGPPGELPGHVKLLFPECEISSWSLFQVADYGITVRGTVATEMPCLGIPVFTAGTGRTHGLGFSNDSATREEYLGKLARIQEFPRLSEEQVALAKRHAHSIYMRRTWIMKSFGPEYGDYADGSDPLAHNIVLRAKSIAEIGQNGDLAGWAAYAAEPGEVDYLSPLEPAPAKPGGPAAALASPRGS